MTTDKTTTTTPADTAAAEMQALQAAEASLRSLAKFSKMDEATAEAFVAKCLAEGTTFEVAKKLALEHMRGVFSNPAIRSQATITSTGNHSLDSLAIGIEDAIMLRAGATRLLRTDNQGNVMLGDDGKPSYRAPHERAAQFRHLPVVEMLRLQLRLLGADVDYLSRPQVAELLSRHQLRRKHPEVFALAQSTSDFGSILENVMGKTLRQMYLEAPRTWDRWARRTTAPDFRAVKRTQLSTSADLVPGGEGSGIQYGILTDSGESYSLSEYKGGIRLTRQAIINDDLDAFGRIPRLQAAAAARLEEDLAIGILTDNDDLADGDPLFDDTARSNVGTAAPFGIDSVAAGYAAIRQQRSLGGSLLDLRPNVLLTSVQLAAAASGFKASVSPTEFANVVPPFLASLEVLDSPRLGADDWFLIAQDYGSIEVCFLESEPMPVLRSETDFDTEDQKFAVRHTVAAKAIDWRGLYQGEHTDEDEG